jgi:regulator of sigma E protease
MDFSQVPSIILLCLGFGFVIFWHELGHFLAAKWAGVKVEQFAVGFGQALFSWRKGLGFRFGSSAPEYEALLHPPEENPDSRDATRRASSPDTSQISETEYRLNWIPLGGYVKMLGQDDLDPNAVSADPRSFNNQSIPKRMVIVSAGVIMNIILAAVGFMVLFLIGFDAPPAVVGSVLPGSPASHTIDADSGAIAPLQVGDRILYLDNKYQHDFTKIMLNTALLEEGAKIPLYVQRRDGTREHLLITPARMGKDSHGLLMLGIGQPLELKGADLLPQKNLPLDKMLPFDSLSVTAGDTITAINGTPVQPNQYYLLDQAVQQSQGKPVQLTIKNSAGSIRTALVQPHIEPPPFGDPIQFAGLLPRATATEVLEKSPVLGKVLPGDVFLSINAPQFQQANPSAQQIQEWLNKSGQISQPVNLQLLRGDSIVDITKIVPSVHLENGKRGLGLGLGVDELHPVVADVAKNSPAQSAGIPAGATLTSIAGQPVLSWFDIQRLLAAATPDQPIDITAKTDTNPSAKYTLKLTQDQITSISQYQYAITLQLHELSEPRKTSNPLVAAEWGVTETRDFILQFYLTIKRMVQGSVSYTNMMGPVGIFKAGTKLAYKGTDWLIWFLCMISANLAVVNFLPIPIVDGGLFTFLIIEKLRGKPLSPYAQQVAQFVGLAVLLGVFLLVTYQDIMR